ncbi:MAG: trehalose 6-phosphate synthase/phosphatase [Clostridiales bacterium]|nr:trehalose 6-phosphate synthase/phosphatase [Clostridiales bacterium]
MQKTIFISNRLPVTVGKEDNALTYSKSIGGLATGLKSYHEGSGGLWAGWAGISEEQLTDAEKEQVKSTLMSDYHCLPIQLSDEDIERYYHGFSNRTIWPLFHYFTSKAEFRSDYWDAYVNVNNKFFEAIDPLIESGDILWIHDYQLMLLPSLIRENHPDVRIGFFLHIPFPSYEIFRTLIWRKEILQGLMGADLVGFHTYDYVRHFLSSVRRILGYEHNLGTILYEDRYVKADVFPMGIDYTHFFSLKSGSDYLDQAAELEAGLKGTKMILSIDRLDYTKGIPERIRAYGRFLEKFPEYQGNVRLNLIVAPSRVEVDSYEALLREIQILVSEINGAYATVNWQPIYFFFQSFSQEQLIAFYRKADVLLVTPIRDGMNLVVKEYIASRNDFGGMVVISETAGAASELGELIIVNANDSDQIADGLKQAIEMPPDEKTAVNKMMHYRLKRYNVEFWADEFMNALTGLVTDPMKLTEQIDLENHYPLITEPYKASKKRLILLDYDGTLVGFKAIPEKAKPDAELRKMLEKLIADPKNTVVIVSGRDHATLERWLGDLHLHLVASHGLWIKHPGETWQMNMTLNNDWKPAIYHVLEVYADRMLGAIIEEKNYSLAFHYRQCDPDLVATKLQEVRDAVLSMIHGMTLSLQEGDKVLEIKDSRVNKGQGVSVFLRDSSYDFIMGVGDDVTDEDLFKAMADDDFSVKVGLSSTHAHYRLPSWQTVRKLIKKLID